MLTKVVEVRNSDSINNLSESLSSLRGSMAMRGVPDTVTGPTKGTMSITGPELRTGSSSLSG